MRNTSIFLIAAVATLASGLASAQENSPVVVPERLQVLAKEYPIAGRLGINWEEAEPIDVGRYIGMLSAANEVAREIAIQSDREEPSDADYLAALAALCFLTNKPPLVEPYWPSQQPAFYSSTVRRALHKAVRPAAVELAQAIQDGGITVLEAYTPSWPKTRTEYFSEVFDAAVVPGAQ